MIEQRKREARKIQDMMDQQRLTAREQQAKQDEAIRAYLAKIPDNRPSDGRSGATWGGKFRFGDGDAKA